MTNSFCKIFGVNNYQHIDIQVVLWRLRNRNWTAVSPENIKKFYELFEKCIHHKFLTKDYLPFNVLDKDGNTALHLAVIDREQINVDPQVVFQKTQAEINRFIRLGVDPNVQNHNGDTILHLIPYLYCMSFQYNGIVNSLLQKGVKANVTNKQGVTAFHRILSTHPTSSIIEQLIRHGNANVNAQDNKGNAALHYIAHSNGSYGSSFDSQIAELLLKHGAKIDLPNSEGNTPFHIAIETQANIGKVIHFFCKSPSTLINTQNNAGNTPLHLLAGFCNTDKWDYEKNVELLLKKGASETIENKKGQLPVSIAFNRSGLNMSELFNVEGVQLMNSDGWTPLHLAAEELNFPIEKFKELFFKHQYLSDVELSRVLHLAISAGNYKVVKFLVDNNISINMPNKLSESPLSHALVCLINEIFEHFNSENEYKKMKEIITILRNIDADSQTPARLPTNSYSRSNNAFIKMINLFLDKGVDPFEKKRKRRKRDRCLF